MSFSRAHYRRVSPPRDTPVDVAARRQHHAALDAAQADVVARYPDGITAENARELLAYQQERIAARIREFCAGGAR